MARNNAFDNQIRDIVASGAFDESIDSWTASVATAVASVSAAETVRDALKKLDYETLVLIKAGNQVCFRVDCAGQPETFVRELAGYIIDLQNKLAADVSRQALENQARINSDNSAFASRASMGSFAVAILALLVNGWVNREKLRPKKQVAAIGA
ncbi:MAG: hypothetical protein ABL879_11005 [Devosia sp.]